MVSLRERFPPFNLWPSLKILRGKTPISSAAYQDAENLILSKLTTCRIENIPDLIGQIFETISELQWFVSALITYAVGSGMLPNALIKPPTDLFIHRRDIGPLILLWETLRQKPVPELGCAHYCSSLFHTKVLSIDVLAMLYALKAHRECLPFWLPHSDKEIGKLPFYQFLKGEIDESQLKPSVIWSAQGMQREGLRKGAIFSERSTEQKSE